MATAFVLINAEMGEEKKLHMQLKEIPEVKETYMVYGSTTSSPVCRRRLRRI